MAVSKNRRTTKRGWERKATATAATGRRNHPRPQAATPGPPVHSEVVPGIPYSLDNILRAVVSTPPKKESEWWYLQGRREE